MLTTRTRTHRTSIASKHRRIYGRSVIHKFLSKLFAYLSFVRGSVEVVRITAGWILHPICDPRLRPSMAINVWIRIILLTDNHTESWIMQGANHLKLFPLYHLMWAWLHDHHGSYLHCSRLDCSLHILTNRGHFNLQTHMIIDQFCALDS